MEAARERDGDRWVRGDAASRTGSFLSEGVEGVGAGGSVTIVPRVSTVS